MNVTIVLPISCANAIFKAVCLEHASTQFASIYFGLRLHSPLAAHFSQSSSDASAATMPTLVTSIAASRRRREMNKVMMAR